MRLIFILLLFVSCNLFAFDVCVHSDPASQTAYSYYSCNGCLEQEGSCRASTPENFRKWVDAIGPYGDSSLIWLKEMGTTTFERTTGNS